ncbi:hypothetical protein K0M31_015655 [Melipona bicolor]|uniref:Replication protein A C-terminal domain-containing protein n=1 Tax=Melipona bicolor TaxID=60889 RepID=A0AA40FET8_9HYME|nr:hypothetical protein K0M31_015655 [Melipona bicolor]
MWDNLDNSVSTSGGFLNDSQNSNDENKKIGIVNHIEKSSTKVTYEIEDETGRITCFQWLAVIGKITQPVINLNTYVRVFGQIKEQNQTKHVLIVKIYPVTTLNELTNHLLEVTFVSLHIQKTSNDNQYKGSDVLMPDDNLGLTKDQVTVFRIIQAENDTVNGIERKTLKNRVPKNILPIIDDIIDFLTSEGHIYTTCTDDHFKTT